MVPTPQSSAGSRMSIDLCSCTTNFSEQRGYGLCLRPIGNSWGALLTQTGESPLKLNTCLKRIDISFPSRWNWLSKKLLSSLTRHSDLPPCGCVLKERALVIVALTDPRFTT